jgi:alpha-1,2-mannosyltransferase
MTGAITSTSPGRLGRAALPIIAILVFAGGIGIALGVAGDTLGFDFRAYYQAARRLLDGGPLYITDFTAIGPFGLYLYPPTAILLVLPLALLTEATAVLAWTALMVAAFVVGVLVLPVSRTVRWWIVLLAGLSWPFVYAIKLGQVGPLLFLTFAVGWRWLDDPIRLGASAAVGSALKLQPGLVFVWAALTGRWRALGIGVVILAALAVVATVLAGPSAWLDFLSVIRTIAEPITTPNNVTPGAVAYQAGLSTEVATAIQIASDVAALLVVVVAARRATAEAAYLVTVVASQLLSPVLWNHYALLLLLPVAYLLAAGRWWALAIPLVTATPLIGLTPLAAYPIAFWATLLAVLIVGVRARATEVRA